VFSGSVIQVLVSGIGHGIDRRATPGRAASMRIIGEGRDSRGGGCPPAWIEGHGRGVLPRCGDRAGLSITRSCVKDSSTTGVEAGARCVAAGDTRGLTVVGSPALGASRGVSYAADAVSSGRDGAGKREEKRLACGDGRTRHVGNARTDGVLSGVSGGGAG